MAENPETVFGNQKASKFNTLWLDKWLFARMHVPKMVINGSKSGFGFWVAC
jgi:hypothetical protein